MYADSADKPELAREAIDTVIWCLAQNSDIYKQWVN